MKKLLFATKNLAKINRFKDKLLAEGIELITLNDLKLDVNVVENGKDVVENALIKAKAYCDLVDIPVMAMDDSLILDNVPVNMQPGLFVRRKNGRNLSDDEVIDFYIKLVNKYGINNKLDAKWVYGMAIINKKENTYTWNKDNFYLTNIKSTKFEVGYPLNSISIDKKTNQYFTDLKSKEINNDSSVINFIVNSL